MDALRPAPARAIRHSARPGRAPRGGAGWRRRHRPGIRRSCRDSRVRRWRCRAAPPRPSRPIARSPGGNSADGVFVADRVLVFEHAFRRQLGCQAWMVVDVRMLPSRTAARSPVAAAARSRRRCAARPRRAWRGCRVPAGRRAAARSGRSARPSFRLFEVDREGGDVARIARADAGSGVAEEAMSWRVLDGVKGDGIRVRAARGRGCVSYSGLAVTGPAAVTHGKALTPGARAFALFAAFRRSLALRHNASPLARAPGSPGACHEQDRTASRP